MIFAHSPSGDARFRQPSRRQRGRRGAGGETRGGEEPLSSFDLFSNSTKRPLASLISRSAVSSTSADEAPRRSGSASREYWIFFSSAVARTVRGSRIPEAPSPTLRASEGRFELIFELELPSKGHANKRSLRRSFTEG